MKATGIVAIVIVIVALGAGAWWLYQSHQQSPEAMNDMNMQDSGDTAAPTSDTLPSGSSTFDASLNADLSAVDSQINGFNSDNASVDGSLSDQPVEQDSI